MKQHRVIIVGGGPAGSTTAWQLRQSGVDCVVLDRETFPREKLCAGWITPDVLTDLELHPRDYPHRFTTYETLHISIKGLKIPLPSPQHSIRRFEFDRWLLERADVPVLHHNVRHITREDGHYVIDGKYRCDYLIGAGGTRCPVFRELFRETRPRAKTAQIVTQELEYAYDWTDPKCRLWFLQNGLPGYSWYVPKADGYLNIGVGGFAHRLKENGDDIKRHWRSLIQQLLDEKLISEPPANPGGYSYYLRPETDLARRDNAFIVGDAAGLATRDLGEGIGPAVRTGLLAARSIATNVPYELASVAAKTSLVTNCVKNSFRRLLPAQRPAVNAASISR